MSLQPTNDADSYLLLGLPLKDAAKNSDRNNPEKVIADSTADESIFSIDLADYAQDDVSAYIYIRMFRYKRGRQTLNFENGGLSDGGDKVVAALLGAVGAPVYVGTKTVLNGVTFSNKGAAITGAASVAGGAAAGAIFITDRTRDKSDYKGSIRLPLISPVNMNYDVNWSEFTNPLNGQSLVSQASEVATALFVDQNAVGAAAQQSQQNSNIINTVAQTANNDYVQNVLANTAAMTFNPDNELVLNGIGLRQHNFEFLLTPKNKKETKIIKDAIQVLKRAMTPSKNAVGRTENGSALLDYPYEFSLFFMDGREGREGIPLNIPPIPDCALVDVNITYNPQGQKFHYDSNVVQYRISLVFKEHQILTRDDIEEGGF